MINIEYHRACSIISSFFDNERYWSEPKFTLDDEVFLHPFHKIVVKKINTSKDLTVLEDNFDEWISIKPQYQQAWLDIKTKFGLPMLSAKAQYDELRKVHLKRQLEGLVK